MLTPAAKMQVVAGMFGKDPASQAAARGVCSLIWNQRERERESQVVGLLVQ